MIQIDEEKCNGCGICVNACHEGALTIENGKAKLIRDDYCDGLGNCLPACPMNAISFIEREALPYDEEAVLANMKAKEKQKAEKGKEACGCPGNKLQELNPVRKNMQEEAGAASACPSMLRQWPVQIKLVPVNAGFLNNADLLIAADCTAYAYGNFHRDFIRGRVTLIGCPKLDNIDYAEKFAEMFKHNDIKSVTVAKMTVPCCTGIENMVRRALEMSGKNIPLSVKTISLEGEIH